MKVSTHDIVSLLRLFERAGDETVARDVTRLVVSNPSPTNTLAQFRVSKLHYALLFDDVAGDNVSYIMDQIAISLPGVSAKLVEHPTSTNLTYGVPYKGKDVYLVELRADTQRLDAYLAERYTDVSRSSWQKHIQQGRVTINGSVTASSKAAVKTDDVVLVDLPKAPDHSDEDLPIVYLDDDIIVVDKPVAVLTHRKNDFDREFTVADFFRRYTTQGLETDRPGVVHRLDRDTSGLVIGARTPESYDHLKRQFSERLVTKTYLAVIDGHLDHDSFNIDLPIARNSASPGSFIVASSGKPAQTSVKVLETTDRYSMLELTPTTGRTHQLRVHLAHMKTPIHGDRLYGTVADRLYLHAHQLRLTTPDGTERKFVSPVPAAFGHLMKDDQ